MSSIDSERLKSNQTWPSVSADRPCPQCGKPNRCRLATDGAAGICWRTGSGEIWRDATAPKNGNHRPIDPAPRKPKPTYISADAAIHAAGQYIAGGVLARVWTYPGDVARVARFNRADGGKEFRPVHRAANGAWVIGDPPGKWPLYRGDELTPGGVVYVVEGEKCADIARSIGLNAVASAHGSAAASKTDWSAMAGRDVVILPDADAPGAKYAADVARLCGGARTKIVSLPDLPDGGDIEQFDAAIGGEPESTRAAIEELADGTPWSEPADDPDRPAPLEILRASDLCRAYPELRQPIIGGLLRRTELMMLVSSAKAGKTYLAIGLAICLATGRAWMDAFPCTAGRVLYVDAECHRQTFARRLAAIASSMGVMMSDLDGRLDIVSLRGQLRNVDALDSFIRAIAPGTYDAIFIDAIYRMYPERFDENSNADWTALMNRLDRWGEMTGAAIIIIHHSSKGNQAGKSVVDVGSGASAQARAVDTHCVLRAHETDGAAVMEAATRSWPAPAPMVISWDYPRWSPAGDLSPHDLKMPKPPKRRATPPPESAEPPAKKWTPLEFASAFVTAAPRAKELILARATDAGMTEREAGRMLILAIDERRIHRHYDAVDRRKITYSTEEQTLIPPAKECAA